MCLLHRELAGTRCFRFRPAHVCLGLEVQPENVETAPRLARTKMLEDAVAAMEELQACCALERVNRLQEVRVVVNEVRSSEMRVHTLK